MAKLGAATESLDSRNEFWAFEVPYKLRNRRRQVKILPDEIANATPSKPDPILPWLLRRAHASRQQLETGAPENTWAFPPPDPGPPNLAAETQACPPPYSGLEASRRFGKIHESVTQTAETKSIRESLDGDSANA